MIDIGKALEQFIDSRLSASLGADYQKFRKYIEAINNRNKELSEIITRQDEKIKVFEKNHAELMNTVNLLASRIEKFEKTEKIVRQAEVDGILQQFNKWAGNPIVPLPRAFAFLAGDFRIRANQQLVYVPEETKWCVNCDGGKKYLLPNPNFFDQMTNILELYEMDQRLLRKKMDNKIKILFPCEISSSGFVEFPGKLELLP
ncbi:MAG: hypothetical protein LBJ35_06315 [Spirochaetaceae bacterium]|jgi:hypothetical protein|nr:hypothetical protein [Spirochaetaceae bacterium]